AGSSRRCVRVARSRGSALPARGSRPSDQPDGSGPSPSHVARSPVRSLDEARFVVGHAIRGRPARSAWAERMSGSAIVGTRRWAMLRSSAMATRAAYTPKELEEFRAALGRERAEVQAQLAELEESSFSTPQSDLSGEVAFDEEYADSGTFTFERERDLSLENNVRDLLAKIARALSRLENGSFGICERCGKPIEKARLKALPYANLCIKDKQAESRR